MHEFTLLQGLLRQIEAVLAVERAEAVTRVKVRIGALAHISESHFREHFREAVRGTRLADALLEVEMGPEGVDPHAQQVLLQQVEVEVGS